MEDEGVVLGAAFGLKDAQHRRFVQGIRAQTVHRFRGDAQKAAVADDLRGFFDFIFPVFGVKYPCFQIRSFFILYRYICHSPRSSPTSTTLMRPAGRHRRVWTKWQQQLSGLLQSAHRPFTLQGVLADGKRCTTPGAV